MPAAKNTVKGIVKGADGTPIRGAKVRAFHKSLRKEVLLGEAETGANGQYTIAYARKSDLNIDLIVRAFSGKQEVAVSGVRFAAKADETVNLTARAAEKPAVSEYEKLSAVITPLLEGVAVTELTTEDIPLLAAKPRVRTAKISHYALASRMADRTGAAPELFYALLEAGLPEKLSGLALQKPNAVRETIRRAGSHNVIPQKSSEQADKVLDALRAAAVKDVLQKPAKPDQVTVGVLLDTMNLEKSLQKDLLNRYAQNEGSTREFWNQLRKEKAFSQPGLVERIQFTFQVGQLTHYHLPMIKALQKNSSLKDLVALEKQDWLDIIKKVGAPANITGATDEEREANYAASLEKQLEAAYPTQKISARVRKSAKYANSDLKRFFEAHDDFDFQTTRIDPYLKQNSEKLRAVSDTSALSGQLKGMQRLYRVLPDTGKFDAMEALTADGINSALAIKGTGRNSFTQQYAGVLGGANNAQTVYDNAANVSAISTNVLGIAAGAYQSIPFALSFPTTTSTDETGFPDLQTLFGSQSYCECEDCRSVYSPAAYLVDLLQFLSRGVANEDGENPLQVLFKRRPDIGDIELSCENTNTPLPYIDLVNEILENAVLSTSEAYQTEGTADELKATPEHMKSEAYDLLAGQVYPLDLPFHLWNEEGRTYLEHLRVQAYDLMDAFQHSGGATEPTDLDKACKHLKLSAMDREIITGVLGRSTKEYWGLTAGNWIDSLSNVGTFLDAADLSYEDLLKLLQVEYVNPAGSVAVDFTNAQNQCDIDGAELTGISEEFLGRAHRFLRLRNKLEWDVLDFGAAITTLAATDLNDTLLVQLSDIRFLMQELHKPVVELLSWWGPLSTSVDENDPDDRSFYAQLFLNKAVMNPVEEVFELNDDGTALAIEGTSTAAISDYSSEIAAALKISTADLSLLVVDDNLTLANLSQLFRMASLADALDLSIEDYLSLDKMVESDPFDASNIAGAVDYVEAVQKLNKSRFSVSQLEYLFRHAYDTAEGIVPLESDVGNLLDELRNGLAKIAEENTFESDPTGETTKAKLAVLLTGDTLEDAIAIIEETSEKTADETTAFIEEYMVFLDKDAAVDELVDIDTSISTEQRIEEHYDFVLENLLTYLAATQSRSLVTQTMAADLGIDLTIAEQLLTELVKSPANADRFAIDEFQDETFVQSEDEITSGAFPAQCQTYLRLHKISLLVLGFKIAHDQLGWIFDNGPGLGWIDPNQLPLTETDDGTALFNAWLRMFDLIALRDGLPSGDLTLLDILDRANHPEDYASETFDDFLETLCTFANWELADVTFLSSSSGFGFSLDDFKDERALTTLKNCLDVLKKVGAPAEELWGWLEVDLTEDQALALRQAVKAKYSSEQWPGVAQSLHESLREKQRTALVSYVLKRDGYEDEIDLFEHYLIDVEMQACMMTSRIKQANSSVQLFVYRCLMNLEPDATLDSDMADQWEWMKNYRLWEANRKVFLYPENWIEPDLRDDSSEFFDDLKNELLQNEVTSDTVETAYMRYLEKIDAVSNIEICGTYYQYEEGSDGDDTIDIFHVVGRTKSYPHTYYYRRREDSATWTPWEHIELDIEGNHVLPVVIDRRLFLFWPIFSEIAEPVQDLIDEYGLQDFIDSDEYGAYIQEHYGTDIESYISSNLKDPFVRYEIQMAYSEYRSDKWLPKRISKDAIYSDFSSSIFLYLDGYYTIDQKDFCFYTKVQESQVTIDCVQTINVKFDTVDDTIRISEGTFTLDNLTRSFVAEDVEMSLIIAIFDQRGITLPVGSDVDYNRFLESSSSNALQLKSESDGTYVDNPVLSKTPGDYAIPIPHQYSQFLSDTFFFYQDDDRSFFVTPQEVPITEGIWASAASAASRTGVGAASVQHYAVSDDVITQVTLKTELKYDFQPFYHPYVGDFIKAVNRDGIEGFLNRDTQLQENDYFDTTYVPQAVISSPIEDVDFSSSGAYSSYNWELFFHIPLLIAVRLSQNQKFEDAMTWFHFIFNPTDRSDTTIAAPQCYWQSKPFYEITETDSIYDLMTLLSYSGDDAATKSKKEDVEAQIAEWQDNPFDPHVIAKLRPLAYMKTVVMKYIDNLIAWGDYLFRQDTIESINEATQLYLIALRILGDRPESVPELDVTDKTYNELAEVGIDAFSNALVQIENSISTSGSATSSSASDTLLTTLYFCIPDNEQLLTYWDTVDDRLFKIRNCMNIEGVVRSLPLFEPPIDPGMLVKARAAGIDLASALSDVNAAVPYYRFTVMLQKAIDFCADVRSLGAALLSALEKKDAEALSLLRSSQELQLMDGMTTFKELQVDEARASLESLKKGQLITQARKDYYSAIEKISSQEQLNLDKADDSEASRKKAGTADVVASALSLLPNIDVSTTGTGWSFGGGNLGAAGNAIATSFRNTSAGYAQESNRASITASYGRRWSDWQLQADLADKELSQIEKQIAAAEIRIEYLEQDLSNQKKQIEQAKDLQDFMSGKYTNRDLYDWMVSQISTIYFQSYQMAYDVAKRAQKAYNYELGNEKTFLTFGYWDSLKKGLLAGEKLHYDLKRMELSYLEANRRTYELTKSVSLASLDPIALLMLKETGECFVELPEAIFDLDYAGHYMRRIVSVSLTIPAVTGPYTSVNCTLTLLENKWREDTSGETYAEGEYPDDRFAYNQGAVQSIATSHGQSDSGVFQLHFNDERYLPFEGAGAISRWRLQMPNQFRNFDYDTISDVVMQISYTAKDGGETLKSQAEANLQDAIGAMVLGSERTGLTRMFSAKHEFSGAWHRFLYPADTEDGQSLTLDMSSDRFPFLVRDYDIKIDQIELVVLLESDARDAIGSNTLVLQVTPAGESSPTALSMAASDTFGGQLYGLPDPAISGSAGEWLIAVKEEDVPSALLLEEDDHKRLNPDSVDDLIVICRYSISRSSE